MCEEHDKIVELLMMMMMMMMMILEHMRNHKSDSTMSNRTQFHV